MSYTIDPEELFDIHPVTVYLEDSLKLQFFLINNTEQKKILC